MADVVRQIAVEQVGVISKGSDEWQTFMDRLNKVLADFQIKPNYIRHRVEFPTTDHCVIYYTMMYEYVPHQDQRDNLMPRPTRSVNLDDT
jgi:hypothetical protein